MLCFWPRRSPLPLRSNAGMHGMRYRAQKALVEMSSYLSVAAIVDGK